jgi:predicted branched-subunit amino acid permease
MSIALKIFVCAFSFAFTAFFVALMLPALSAPVAGALRHSGHSVLAALVTFSPVLLALSAGIAAARIALRYEQERQSRQRANRS